MFKIFTTKDTRMYRNSFFNICLLISGISLQAMEMQREAILDKFSQELKNKQYDHKFLIIDPTDYEFYKWGILERFRIDLSHAIVSPDGTKYIAPACYPNGLGFIIEGNIKGKACNIDDYIQKKLKGNFNQKVDDSGPTQKIISPYAVFIYPTTNTQKDTLYMQHSPDLLTWKNITITFDTCNIEPGMIDKKYGLNSSRIEQSKKITSNKCLN